MSYHYDWLKQQIEIIAAMLAYILANKKNSIRSVEEAQAIPSGENELYLLLSALVRQGKLCRFLLDEQSLVAYDIVRFRKIQIYFVKCTYFFHN